VRQAARRDERRSPRDERSRRRKARRDNLRKEDLRTMPHSFVRRSMAFAVRGFTLIEMMITVAIVAILAGVAVPAYSDYMRRGQLQEGIASLSDFRVKMEQYYQDNRNYGVAGCADVNAPSWAVLAPTKNFSFACALSGANASGGRQQYTVTATGISGRATGHVFTIANFPTDPTQRTTLFKNAAVNKNCWLVKGTEC
jgi:type IV pilus assembly protein PilE